MSRQLGGHVAHPRVMTQALQVVHVVLVGRPVPRIMGDSSKVASDHRGAGGAAGACPDDVRSRPLRQYVGSDGAYDACMCGIYLIHGHMLDCEQIVCRACQSWCALPLTISLSPRPPTLAGPLRASAAAGCARRLGGAVDRSLNLRAQIVCRTNSADILNEFAARQCWLCACMVGKYYLVCLVASQCGCAAVGSRPRPHATGERLHSDPSA